MTSFGLATDIAPPAPPSCGWQAQLYAGRRAIVSKDIYAAGSRRKLQSINWLLIDDLVRAKARGKGHL
jgi:hypothetical protein